MKIFMIFGVVLITSSLSYGLYYLNKEDDWDEKRSRPKVDLVAKARDALMQVGNIYEHEPTSVDAPLTPELVLNNYWRSLANKSQEEKDDALKKVLDINFSYRGYFLERYHYAAAAFIKANLNMAGANCCSGPLYRAALIQDEALCALLLQKGADPNWKKNERDDAPLFNVKKESIVQLFLAVGAQVSLHGYYDKQTLLHQAMANGYEAVLVKLYIQKGINPLITSGLNITPLHSLAYSACDSSEDLLKEKECYLFEPLDSWESKELIEAEYKRLDGIQNAFTILQSKNHPNCQWLNDNLKARLAAISKKEKLF